MHDNPDDPGARLGVVIDKLVAAACLLQAGKPRLARERLESAHRELGRIRRHVAGMDGGRQASREAVAEQT